MGNCVWPKSVLNSVCNVRVACQDRKKKRATCAQRTSAFFLFRPLVRLERPCWVIAPVIAASGFREPAWLRRAPNANWQAAYCARRELPVRVKLDCSSCLRSLEEAGRRVRRTEPERKRGPMKTRSSATFELSSSGWLASFCASCQRKKTGPSCADARAARVKPAPTLKLLSLYFRLPSYYDYYYYYRIEAPARQQQPRHTELN